MVWKWDCADCTWVNQKLGIKQSENSQTLILSHWFEQPGLVNSWIKYIGAALFLKLCSFELVFLVIWGPRHEIKLVKVFCKCSFIYAEQIRRVHCFNVSIHSADDWIRINVPLDRTPCPRIPPDKGRNIYSQHKYRRVLVHSGPTHWHEILFVLLEIQVPSHTDAFPSQPGLELAEVTYPSLWTSWGTFLLYQLSHYSTSGIDLKYPEVSPDKILSRIVH